MMMAVNIGQEAWAVVEVEGRQDAQVVCQTSWMMMSEPDESYDVFSPSNWVYFTRWQ